jgi:hypothetical protein
LKSCARRPAWELLSAGPIGGFWIQLNISSACWRCLEKFIIITSINEFSEARELTRRPAQPKYRVRNLKPRVPDIGRARAGAAAMTAGCSDIAVTANGAGPDACPRPRTKDFIGHRPARRANQLRTRSTSPQLLTQRSSAAIAATNKSAIKMRSSDILCSTLTGGSTVVSLPAAPAYSAADQGNIGAEGVDHKVYLVEQPDFVDSRLPTDDLLANHRVRA